MGGGLMMDLFANISNGKIDWPSTFVTMKL
jgi:hypothetical protein